MEDCLAGFRAEICGKFLLNDLATAVLFIVEKQIRLAGTCLSISYLFASLAIFCVTALGASLWAPWFWVFGIANPLCVSMVLWLMLIESKRRRIRCMKLESGRGVLVDRSFEEDVRSMWNNKMKFGFAIISATLTALAAAAPLNINLGAYSPALVVGDGAIGFNGGEGEAAAEGAAALEGQGIASN
ncbi:hypothetical protein M434DRAFT_29895 [Hypoxylon sp. CO27-5]|nr:hypothetical protein M434DRAFT_29895 [Hypoxylon sp. CO27-5]